MNRTTGVALLVLWLGVVVAATVAQLHIAGVPTSLYGVCNLEFFFGMSAAYIVRKHSVPVPKVLLVLT